MADPKEPLTMSHEEFEKRNSFSFWAGKASGLEEMAVELRQKAGVAFGLGRDREAEATRELANLLVIRANACRKKQQEYR